MKKLILIAVFFTPLFTLLSSFSPKDNMQDIPGSKKGDHTVRVVRITDGVKTVMDTLSGDENLIIRDMEALDLDRMLKWLGKAPFRIDSLHRNFEFRFLEPEGEEDERFIFHPGNTALPQAPRIIRVDKRTTRNTIDLSDPAIISYKRKKIRGGREKIVIIREVVPEKQ